MITDANARLIDNKISSSGLIVLPFFILAADQSRVMQEQMTMQAGGMPQDPKQAYKAEWEALEITEHNWALRNAEQEMISTLGPTQDNLYHQSIVGH